MWEDVKLSRLSCSGHASNNTQLKRAVAIDGARSLQYNAGRSLPTYIDIERAVTSVLPSMFT